MKIQNNIYPSIEQVQEQLQTKQKPNMVNRTSGKTFQEILAEKKEITFSKHASNRLEDRKIVLTKDQIQRLTDGTQKAGEKGIKDTLVMVDKLAFIVNVPNKIVVTAMDQMETNENIFTNIDGAVIV